MGERSSFDGCPCNECVTRRTGPLLATATAPSELLTPKIVQLDNMRRKQQRLERLEQIEAEVRR